MKTKVQMDLPDLKNGKSAILNGLIRIHDSLKLDPLENGFDSIGIRLWMAYRNTDSIQVVYFKKTNDAWSATLTIAIPHFDLKADSLIYYRSDTKQLTFKSNPDTFFQNLKKLDLLTLPDFTKLQGLNLPFDSGSGMITFEISTLTLYRIFLYPAPHYHKGREAINAAAILDSICYQFSIAPLRKL